MISSVETPLEETRKKIEGEQESKKRGPYKKVGSKKKTAPEFTAEGVIALLKLPYQLAGGFTGFDFNPIKPEIETALAASALQVIKDFGFETASKYINLAVFIALYGSCGMTWVTVYNQHKTDLKALKKSEPEPEKSGNSDLPKV